MLNFLLMPCKRRRLQGLQRLLVKKLSADRKGVYMLTHACDSLLYDKSREVKVVLTLRVWASAVAPMGVMSL